ncbi:MAG: pantoate--beta-alanine ligase [Gammaproteobacteria bacterium]|nr:pantoate--beta-alanine ligase [Gammaproteobacteria bacterium]
MILVETISEIRQALLPFREARQTIAFVPTMGNLHAGHCELVKEARKRSGRVVVSIFVNPLQFGKSEDFEQYPRTLKEDVQKLEEAKVDVLFTPSSSEMYPKGLTEHTQVRVPGLSEIHCGKFRPGHFEGVATVVLKLFQCVCPHVAFFGEKDYQQYRVIVEMVKDLCLPIEVLSVPTIREASGLAMSSRNGYLSQEERSQATHIYKVLKWLQENIQKGRRDFFLLEEQGQHILKEAGIKPQELSISRRHDLKPAGPHDTALIALAAAFVGETRLIDNILIDLP